MRALFDKTAPSKVMRAGIRLVRYAGSKAGMAARKGGATAASSFVLFGAPFSYTTNSKTEISGGAPMRMGTPIVPMPRLT